MRKLMTATAVGMASLTLLIAGCSGSGGDAKAPAAGGGGAGSTVALKMDDIKYDKLALSATKGQMLMLTMTNVGALDHDFTIEKIDAVSKFGGKDAKTEKYAVQAVVKTKANGTLEITPNAAGIFEYFCSVPGHKEAGMKGVLTVK